MTEVLAMTDGVVRLAPGTLYTNIKRLLGNGLIEEVGSGPGSVTDERRRYYRLTARGQKAVIAEVDRMRMLVGATQPWLRRLDE